MKKIIRLTESDLVKLVKKIIKESDDTWSDDNEKEFISVRDKYSKLRDTLKKKEDEILSNYRFVDLDGAVSTHNKIKSLYDEPEYKSTSDKHGSLLRKKRDYSEKERYGSVVKNRPSDFDVESYTKEYNKLNKEIDDIMSKHPNLKNFSSVDEFMDAIDDFNSSKLGELLKSKKQRRDYIGKQLDKDYKR